MNTNPKSSSYIWKQRVLALRTLIILIGGLLLLAGASSVKAGTGIDTWNGAAGDNNWNTAGNWALNSSNTPPATGDTPAFGTQGAGSLTLNNDISGGSFLGLTFNANAPSFVLNGNAITTTGGLADNSPNFETVNLPIVLGTASHSVTVANSAGSMLLGGIISDGGGGFGITKTGNGNVTLTNVNTYTGPTAVNAGQLTLDFTANASGIVSASSVLNLGGGTLSVIGNVSSLSSQSFASTTLNTGSSAITPGANTPTLNLGAFTTTFASTVVFNGLPYSTAPTTASGQTGSVGNADPVTGLQGATITNITTSGTAGQVLQSTTGGGADYFAYGTVGLYDFAAQTASGIVGYSQVSGGTANDGGYYCETAGFDFNNAVNESHYDDIVQSFNLPSANTTSMGGYRYNANAAVTTGLRGAQSVTAILVTPNVGANNVNIAPGTGSSGGSGASLAPGLRSSSNAGSLVIYQNNVNGFLFMTVLLSNGKTSGGSFVQTGAGTVAYFASAIAGGANSYTGRTYLNGGVSLINNDAAFGAAATAAPIYMNGGTVLGNANFTLDNGSTATSRAIAINLLGGGLAATAGNTMTVDGIVSNSLAGTGPLTIGIPASSANGNVAGQVPGTGTGTANPATNATGTVVLNAANTFSGGTVVLGGANLNINGINALGGANYGGLTLNGGTLQYATAFSGNGSGDLTSIGTAGITLAAGGGTIDLNGNNVTYAGSIGNSGSGALTVKSSVLGGVLNLGGANTYTGNTTINSGSLFVNNTSGSGTGSGNVSVASGATLGGTGHISGNVNWQSGSFASFTSGSPLTVGVVTLNNNTLTVNVPGITPLGVGSYTLMNYTTAGSTGAFNTGTPTYTGAGAAAGTISSVATSGGVVTLTIIAAGVSAAWNVDADGNWSDGTKWSSNPNIPHAAGDAATFGAGSVLRTVTLDTNITVGGIDMTNPNSFVVANTGKALTLDNKGSGALVAVTAGTANAINASLALNDNAFATVSGGDSLAVNGVITNITSAKTLTVNGAGTTILAAANSYGPTAGSTGTTLSGGGTLNVANSSALGAGDLSVVGANGGTLQAGASGLVLNNNIGIGSVATVDNNGNNLTLNGTISGGPLTKTGNGTLTLNGNNTYSGSTTVNRGVLSVSSAANVQNTPVIIINGGDLSGNGTFAAGNNIGIGSTIGSTGTNALIDATSGMTFTVNGVIATAGNTGSNSLTINSVASPAGTVALGSANTFGGDTTIASGTLQLANSLALQNSTLDYNSGTLDFGTLTAATLGGLNGSKNLSLVNDSSAAVALTIGNNSSSTTYTGGFSDGGAGGSLSKVGTGTLILAGNSTIAGAASVNNGVLQINTGGIISCTAANVIAGLAGEIIVSGGSLTCSAASNIGIPSIGMLVSSGSATFNGGLSMDLANNFNSTITVSGGTLTASSLALGRTGLSFTGQPGAGSTTSGLYVNGGTVDITGNLNMGTASAANSSVNTRIDSGSLTVGGVLTIGLNNGGRWSDVDVHGGFLTVTDDVGGISIGGPLAGDAVLLIRGGTTTAGIINLGNAVADTVALVETNGSLYVGAGGIVVGSAATPIVTLNGGILGATTNWSSSANMTLASDNGGITIQAADASGNPQNISLGGVLSGTILTKTGGGTLTLGGGNSYNGLTTVSNGTLILSTAHAGDGDVIVNDGKTFGVSNILSSAASALVGNVTMGTGTGPTTLTFANVADPATPVLNASAGTFTLNGNCTIKITDKANLAPGTVYPLIKYTTIVTNSGPGFSLSLPPSVMGVLTNDTSITLSLLVTSTNAVSSPPHISGIAVSGNDLVLNATGGSPGATVYVLSTTNLATPHWTTNSTTAFDGSGNLVNYTITGALSSGLRQQYFRLQE